MMQNVIESQSRFDNLGYEHAHIPAGSEIDTVVLRMFPIAMLQSGSKLLGSIVSSSEMHSRSFENQISVIFYNKILQDSGCRSQNADLSINRTFII